MIKYTGIDMEYKFSQINNECLLAYCDNCPQTLATIKNVAREIREKADTLVVIGVGGSFLGARAVIDALTPYFRTNNGVQVVYAGQNMSGAYLKQLLTYLDTKEVYVNVISKSGSTMEPALAFRIMKQYMEQRYGGEAQQRIIVTTDAQKGILKEIAQKEGYRQFEVPQNVGGRYSVFTPVGLLPIATAGIDIIAFLNGAREAAYHYSNQDVQQNTAMQYAITRFKLYQQGYKMELLASFEPRLSRLHEWWKQLFGESEGKQQKGLYPSTVNYSTDLHAIGQFIQQGSPILFETLIHFEKIEEDVVIPFIDDNIDGLNYLADCSLNAINATSKDGVAFAHQAGGVPVLKFELPVLDAYHIGYLMMFFMKACVMSASLLGVNPYDQPGVEAYKEKMIELLKKELQLLTELDY